MYFAFKLFCDCFFFFFSFCFIFFTCFSEQRTIDEIVIACGNGNLLIHNNWFINCECKIVLLCCRWQLQLFGLRNFLWIRRYATHCLIYSVDNVDKLLEWATNPLLFSMIPFPIKWTRTVWRFLLKSAHHESKLNVTVFENDLHWTTSKWIEAHQQMKWVSLKIMSFTIDF